MFKTKSGLIFTHIVLVQGRQRVYKGAELVALSCTKCGDVKGLNEFNKQKSGFAGKHSSCRECEMKRYYEREKKRKTTEENGLQYTHTETKWGRQRAFEGEKLVGLSCKYCEEIKSLKEFNDCRRGFAGKQSSCRVCETKRYSENAKKKKDKQG